MRKGRKEKGHTWIDFRTVDEQLAHQPDIPRSDRDGIAENLSEPHRYADLIGPKEWIGRYHRTTAMIDTLPHHMHTKLSFVHRQVLEGKHQSQ
jgi:hypothetical protein